MILTPRTIELVADRIEQAYLRRRPRNMPLIGDIRVWTIAAQALLEAHQRASWLPLDPELFVAAQTVRRAFGDPWTDLSPHDALRRYRRQILRIVQNLRKELRTEVRRVEGLVRRGEDLAEILGAPRHWLSPLGGYIAAHRLKRPELMEDQRSAARDQHDSCPLYRLACRGYLPSSAYPVLSLVPGVHLTPRSGPPIVSFSLN